ERRGRAPGVAGWEPPPLPHFLCWAAAARAAHLPAARYDAAMPFSLKWLLAGMLYAALIAAAFTQNSWHYADALWAIAFLAFGSAAVQACLARGERRASALGFTILSLMYAACAHFAPASLPMTRWVVASLPETQSGGPMRLQ